MGIFMSNASRLGSFFKSGSLSQLGSFLGSIGIAGSLLLVAYELKQSREIAELQFAYQRVDLKQKIEGPPSELTELEWDRLHMKAYSEGLSALTEQEKVYWASSNVRYWDGIALRYETYKRGYLSEGDWQNDIWWLEQVFCNDDLRDLSFYSIFDPMFSEEFWQVILDVQANVNCDQPDPAVGDASQ